MADRADRFTLESTALPLRSLPPNAYLVHATNCLATWGAGIAAELAKIFPAACDKYKAFNRQAAAQGEWPPARSAIAGKCLIIPPQESDVAAGAPCVYIVCLFTSYGYGKADPGKRKPGKDAPERILEQTRSSLVAFREQLDADHEPSKGGEGVVIYSPMFNSGAFKVPWERTTALVEQSFERFQGRWVVLTPPS